MVSRRAAPTLTVLAASLGAGPTGVVALHARTPASGPDGAEGRHPSSGTAVCAEALQRLLPAENGGRASQDMLDLCRSALPEAVCVAAQSELRVGDASLSDSTPPVSMRCVVSWSQPCKVGGGGRLAPSLGS